MSKPRLLMTTSMLDAMNVPVDDHFEVTRVRDIDAARAEIDAMAEEVKAIATGGHGHYADGAFMDRFPNLKIIANFGVGYDGVDTAAAHARGVIVTNTPDVLTEEVADVAVGLLIMTIREFGQAEQYLRDGRWASEGDYPLTKLSLRERSVGIVGLGRIGAAIAKRCEAFGLPISYFGRTEKPEHSYRFYSDLTAMARDVDTMIVVTPGTPETKNIVNAEVLSALGDTGVLVNVARGSVVDETALIAALRAKTIAAAGLDVMWNEPNINPELMTLENCTLLPHVGSASQHTRYGMADLVLKNLIAMKDGTPPPTPVPETPFTGW